MGTVTRLMTADDLWRLPKDGMRHELVKGVLQTMPPAGFEHGAVVTRLTYRMAGHAEPNKLGLVTGAETGFLSARNPDTVRAADVAFVSQERIAISGVPKTFYPEAPNLAVEVLSPGDRVSEVDEKVEEWLTAGTQLVWVVSPRWRTVTVYRSRTDITTLTENDELDGGTVLPGFRCRVGDLFV